MSEPISAPDRLERDDARTQDDRPLAGAAVGTTGPDGGYAAISIGRWWHAGKSATSR